jgi:hypothetical protein
MSNIQDFLDREAQLSNEGKGDSAERQQILTVIRLMRDESQRPFCFGQDDCSTWMLVHCPWRFDCGADATYNWGG